MIGEARTELVAALEAAGLRVAEKAGDITPPVCYLRIGQGTDAGGPLAGGVVVTFFVHYIPIRGIDNPVGDAEALDAILGAVRPLAVAPLVFTWTSVSVLNESWPCYRFDLPALALDPAEVS
jgi:hypothetical protein